MAKLVWNESLVLGVADMDRDHQRLIVAMDKVCTLDAEDAGKSQIDAAFQELIKLTEQHFADEERYMESIEYGDLKRHRRIHVDMLDKIGEYYRAFEQGAGRLPTDFSHFLVYWLGAHIKGIDMKYAKHLVGK